MSAQGVAYVVIGGMVTAVSASCAWNNGLEGNRIYGTAILSALTISLLCLTAIPLMKKGD